MTAVETHIVKAVHAEQAPRAAPPPAALVDDALAESFRLLALNIQRLLEGDSRRSVLVMSAHPEDGRTLVVVRLAQALAEVSEPILVLDVDPLGSADFRSAHSLRVVAPARLGPTTQASLISKARDVLSAAEGEGLTVIIDTPPCTRSSVAFHLARRVGGVLYVARRRREDLAVHADVRSQLDLLGARVLGIVFNEE